MIRYYEQRGVIRGAQARDGHRRYTDDEVRRLRRPRPSAPLVEQRLNDRPLLVRQVRARPSTTGRP